MKEGSVVLTEELHQELVQHLIRLDGQEDLCFATYAPSSGINRFTAIVTSIIMPEVGDREVHGNVTFFSKYVERALKTAKIRGEGLIFLHSHPAKGWQGMSRDDIIAEKCLSPSVYGVTQLPLLGMTLGIDEVWSARFWKKHPIKRRFYHRLWCKNVKVVGKKLSVSFIPQQKSRINPKRQIRTISAWGEQTQKELSQLKIGIVGLGSVGSMVAEILSRMGFTKFVLIDFDRVEEKNLDRLVGVYPKDIGKPKVDVIAKSLKRSASSKKIHIDKYQFSICEEMGFRASLDCDVLFSCVDRPWPRQVLNFVAYAHLIPVIDGGIKVRTNTKNTIIKGADWKTQIVGVGRTCLACLGQYETHWANLERQGLLDDSNYIEGLLDKSVVDSHENVFVFSSHLASMEVMQLLSLVIAPSGIKLGQQIYHFVTGTVENVVMNSCEPHCFFNQILGEGDLISVKPFGEHKVAEVARKNH
jgi:molybdopterin/thiamine biosynthesis adenylyltransferase